MTAGMFCQVLRICVSATCSKMFKYKYPLGVFKENRPNWVDAQRFLYHRVTRRDFPPRKNSDFRMRETHVV